MRPLREEKQKKMFYLYTNSFFLLEEGRIRTQIFTVQTCFWLVAYKNTSSKNACPATYVWMVNTTCSLYLEIYYERKGAFKMISFCCVNLPYLFQAMLLPHDWLIFNTIVVIINYVLPFFRKTPRKKITEAQGSKSHKKAMAKANVKSSSLNEKWAVRGPGSFSSKVIPQPWCHDHRKPSFSYQLTKK